MSDPAVVVRATTRQSFTVGATASDASSYAAAASASGIISGSNSQSSNIDDSAVRVDMNRVHQARQAQEAQRKSGSSGDHRRSRNDHGKQAGADDKSHHRHKHRVTRESPSDSFSGKYAVDVRGVSHSYDGKKDVLHKLDLQIETGQIYGLLGPSGCGKTTLIKALLAQLDPKEGDIKIFGEKPGSVNSQVPGHDVGYMPQEIALYDEFTVQQNLHFFAKMHHMNEKDFQRRAKYLCKLLDLQDPNGKNAGQLSGGQKRRASLACGLLHSPKLLILDEPTVGVDPTLRSKIWKYLVKISRDEGTTVLLTTHYIEEARRAHRVGLMRDGKMLKQGTPKEIMKQSHCKTLEASFLKICKEDEKKSEEEGKKKEKRGDDQKGWCGGWWGGGSGGGRGRGRHNHESEEEEDDSSDEPSEQDEDDLSGLEDAADAGAGGMSEEDEAEAAAKNEGGGGGAGADAGGDNNADDEDDDEYDDHDVDAAKGSGKKQSNKHGKTFAGLKHDDFHEPLLPGGATSPLGATAAGNKQGQQRSRHSRPAHSPQHLQSPEVPSGDADDDVHYGGGGWQNKDKGGSEANRKANKPGNDEQQHGTGSGGGGKVQGWDKFSTTLALPRWPQLFGLCWKNVMRMLKGVAAMIFQFILPSIQVILFCVAIGKDPQHIHFGIVNHDAVGNNLLGTATLPAYLAHQVHLTNSPRHHPAHTLPEWAAHIVRTSGQAGVLGSIQTNVAAVTIADDPPKPVPADFLSASFIAELDDHFITRNYASEAQARDAVTTNAVWGYVYIPTNFTLNTLARVASAMIDPLAPISNDTLANSTLRYTLDMSNEQMTIFLVKSISASYSSLIHNYAPDLEKNAPLQMNDPVYGDPDASFTDFVAPGIIITIAFSGSIGLTAITFVLDKKTGNLDRIWASGVRASEIMLAQVLTQLIIFVVQIALLLMFGLLVFHLPSKGSVLLLYIICVLLGVTGMMLGLVIASKVTEERDAMQLALGLFFPALLLSGVMWPVESIPTPLYQISLGLPTTWAAEAGRSIMSRGWGIEHRQVWLGLVVPLAWSFVFFLWAAKSLRPKK